MSSATPHPIPYQGSKRRLARAILQRFPSRVQTLYEPFAGSAAVTLAAAEASLAERYHLNDSLDALRAVWTEILQDPDALADAYETLWNAQGDTPADAFQRVRSRFNAEGGAHRLLFLLARCVKNAVRFNADGAFNQSPDNRRLGTRPQRMRANILGAHRLLAERTSVSGGDYEAVLAMAGPGDLVYMDPPYQGTSDGRDQRYHQSLDLERFIANLHVLRERRVPFIVSFDGRSGSKVYGERLPGELGLTRLEIHGGRSSQATLLGRSEQTWESLYLSPDVVAAPTAFDQGPPET